MSRLQGGAGFNKAAVSSITDEGSGEFVRGGLMRKRNLSVPCDRSVFGPAIWFSFETGTAKSENHTRVICVSNGLSCHSG